MPNRTITALILASATVIAACPAATAQPTAPNLTGSWSGSIVGGARFGALNHDPAQKDPVFADRQKVWTLTVDKQDGSGLIGTWSTATKRENLVGAIRQDNVTIVFADEDNLFDGRLLSENEMELCAQEAGAATIAVCYVLKRQ